METYQGEQGIHGTGRMMLIPVPIIFLKNLEYGTGRRGCVAEKFVSRTRKELERKEFETNVRFFAF